MIEDDGTGNDRPRVDASSLPDESVDAVFDDSIGGSFARLVESGHDYVRAEMDRHRLRAGLVGTALRQVAILIGMAAMLMFATVLALMVGLIIALSPVMGPGGATAVVIVGTLVIAVVLVLVAKGRITRLKETLKP